MIFKIGTTVINSSASKAKNLLHKVYSTKPVLNTEKGVINQTQTVLKIKRFFEELNQEIKAFFKRIFKKEELPKSEKSLYSKISYSEKQQKELEEQAKQRNMVKWRKEDNEKLIKKAGHSVSSGDIDKDGYLTSSGQKKIDNPSFKGCQDDVEQVVENHLRKDTEFNPENLDINDKYTDLQYGKHSHEIEQHTDSTLLEAIQENQNQRHHLEQHADDVINHTEIEQIDDIPDSLFN